ncbi:exonuclease [Natrinema sp. 1APR25-10V2]|uniref:exonuclease n=1 Tax=Natrinema sp. 1APR25-10V2 TaxID=2951081 RepID=UPI002876A4F1|nr:exonuclease [Natrinema sp. 1APR25-10V2]MDS0474327.1 exonuclease [Natrinema sp. 1APR25-10V2]
MSTEGRSAEPASATSALESAGFVRLVARADGDALAASGLIASALAAAETPFQVTVGRTIAERSERLRKPTGDGDATVVVGTADGAADADNVLRLAATDRPASLEAVDLVRDLGATPDPVLALAGVVAAGGEPGAGESEWLVETARERDLLERRPGVAVPTADPIDGLAHSTRVRAPWSGDPDAARDALADAADGDPASFDADDHRAIGSLVALDAVGAEGAADAAAASIARALRPYATPDGPFATLGGFADVLEATARTEPGTGTALAMGHDVRERALEAWRERGRRAHAALEGASTGRYDGLFVVGIDDGPVEAVARLAAAYRSPEPTVLVVANGEGQGPSGNQAPSDDGEAAIATRETDPLGATVEGVARDLEGAAPDSATDAAGVDYDVGHRRGYLRYDPGTDESTIIAAVRDLL